MVAEAKSQLEELQNSSDAMRKQQREFQRELQRRLREGDTLARLLDRQVLQQIIAEAALDEDAGARRHDGTDG